MLKAPTVGKGGYPVPKCRDKKLDSRFHGNDDKDFFSKQIRSTQGNAGEFCEKQRLPRNCKGSESPKCHCPEASGWEGGRVGGPESGDPDYLENRPLRGKRRQL